MEYNSENKLILKNVTLIAVSSVKLSATIKAIEHSIKNIEFGSVKLVTDANLTHDKIKIEKCNNIFSLDEYSRFMIYDLNKYVDTDFVITVQHDGFVVNPDKWKNEFLNYDYIGAPWPDKLFYDDFGEMIRVGNGGFSLRSKKLLNIFLKHNIEWRSYRNYWNEDGFISMHNLHFLRDNGVKFPDVNLAYKFSREYNCDELDNSIEPFGFHNYRDKNSQYPRF
jgi:hypothetical protein